MRHELSDQSLSAQNFIITLCNVSVLWDLLQAYTVLVVCSHEYSDQSSVMSVHNFIITLCNVSVPEDFLQPYNARLTYDEALALND